jgi:hypothetical protein
MSLTDDLRQFAAVHSGHGTVTYTASAATESGYDLDFVAPAASTTTSSSRPRSRPTTSWRKPN